MTKMQRTVPFADKLQKIVRDITDFEVREGVVYCTVCQKYLRVWHKTQCVKHTRTNMHRSNQERGIPRRQFIFDLCVMLCVCNLSFHLVDNRTFREFWKKYATQGNLPSSVYISQKVLPRVYDIILNKLKGTLKNKYIYVTVNETTDQQLHKVVHVLVRCLEVDHVSTEYLICSKRVVTTTAPTQCIVSIVETALNNVNVAAERVLLFVTDTAPHMKRAGDDLKEKFPNMVHITCLAQGLHEIAEEVQKQYDNVDNFVSATNNIFAKAPDRRRAFCNTTLNVPLPPEPDHTRWGTWLACVFYYAKYFEEVKKFILTLSPRDSGAIATSQRYFHDSTTATDIRLIEERFRTLAIAITKLNTESLSLVDSLSIVDGVMQTIGVYSDRRSVDIQNKIQSVLSNNPGYATALRIRNELTSSKNTNNIRQFYSYGPLTSVDVEKLLSVYKGIVRPNRKRLNEKSIEWILVILYYCKTLTHPLSILAQ